MAIQVVRFDAGEGARWGVHKQGTIISLRETFNSTREFLLYGGREAAASATGRSSAQEGVPTFSVQDVDLLSPVTRDADYICQGLNYYSHLLEVGRSPSDATHNVFFMKASSSIVGPNVDITRPTHIRVLDYENEIGLVLAQDIDGPRQVTPDNLHEWVAGLVITNDVSAREDQVSAEQFYKAKSYRTFGPTGPYLVLLGAEELARFQELQIQTRVNGELRQDHPASDMVFTPAPTLTELSEMRDMRAGDLIATGTPAGVGMSVPGGLAVALSGFLSKTKRLHLFLDRQAGNPKILQPGDRLELSIRTPDGAIDLGTQSNLIVQG